MEFRFNIGNHVAIVGPFGDAPPQGAKGKVVGINRLEYDGHQVLDDVTVLFDRPLFRDGAFQTSFTHSSEYFEHVNDIASSYVPMRRRLKRKQHPPYDFRMQGEHG